ncbi:hypothetical protein HPULCUR_003308 [Helicostylum pulchrum]|uniref:Uncharacterized protein n=1 Tax=Helicostylum pulchrum TaxID=562976 RepID=A0ABP9XSZ9_9FUNG
MASLQQELSIFLTTNIATDQDLNLDQVKSLLDLRKQEQVKLDDKLDTLTTDTRSILKTSLDRTRTHQDTLQTLESSLTRTTNEMDTFISDSQAPLLDNLTTLEQNLRTVETAKGYIKALLVASELASQALQLVQTKPDRAIIPYIQLIKLERYIEQQGQYQELSAHLKNCQMRLKQELNEVLIKNFKDSLDALAWPTPVKPPYGPQLKAKLKVFEKAFCNLLILQQSSESDPSEAPEDTILSPISIMLEPLSLRFRFHFETSKPTNRVDKPEWYLTHVKNTITTHTPFLMTTIQPILETVKQYLPQKTFVKDQFIRGLVQDVSRKLQKTMPQLLNHPSWLSHTIHQVLEFDQSLQDEFAYDGYMELSQSVLGNYSWFNAWFNAEKSFSQSRYDEIMLDRQAFDIYAEDDMEKSTLETHPIKRTKSAVRLINLLENITNAYKLVPNINQRTQFLTQIQLNLLNQYQKRLTTAIDSFEALCLIRSVPVPGALPDSVTGVMTATESGNTVASLNRLYRWWTSARCMTDILKDWNEDEFFINMQFELNASEKDVSSNGLFANACQSFEQLIKRIEKIMVKVATKEWISDTRKYAKKDTWWQTSTEASTEISDELYEPLQDLRVTWNYLHSILPQVDFLIIYRQTLKEIEDWYWKHVLTQSQFSSSGALQLETDVKLGLWKVGQQWVLKPENLTKQLKEAIQLLTLPFSSEAQKDTDIPSCDVLMKALADPKQSEFVQKTLDKLGIDVLNNTQIRNVLRRRNDMFAIAKTVELGKSTVQSIVSRINRTGSPLHRKSAGAPKKVDERVKRQMERTVKKDPFATYDDLRLYLKEAGFGSYFAAHKPRLTERQKIQRLRWVLSHVNWTKDQ